jgi:hypothetical protein
LVFGVELVAPIPAAAPRSSDSRTSRVAAAAIIMRVISKLLAQTLTAR